ncbi:TPA: protein phosphatase 2C [Bacillus pseudomycoides]|nr:protein phosphatase 2C [Bacillus pseudomycoides]
MLKKLKKFMVVAAAAVMLSAGFVTAAPNEAHAAHWADTQMNWAMNKGYITADLRDNLATRQDVWLILTRAKKNAGAAFDYNYARDYVIGNGISDGTRGTNWVTRDECAAMILRAKGFITSSSDEFSNIREYGKKYGIYDGSRGNDFATRAEVVTMMYNVH